MGSNSNKYNLPRLYAKELICFFKLLQSQHFSRERINEFQDQKLMAIIRYAGMKVPYYRNLFKDIGLDVNEFRGREDMKLIPLLDKDTFRAQNKEFIADGALNRPHGINKTSGSTGTPLEILIDENGMAYKSAAVFRAMYWAGYLPLRKVFLIKGLSESKATDWGYDHIRRVLFLNSSRLSKENCLAVAKEIVKFKPSFFMGYARSYIDLYKVIEENGIKIKNPVGIFCNGETITPAVRDFLEEKFHTRLYDHYGNRENVALINQMPDHKRYMMEDYFYPELIDIDGKPADNGYGELVGTSFFNFSMPLIRYKTRDYVRLSNSREGCKYAFTPVDFIEGRMDDYILLPDGRKIYFAEGALLYAKGVVTGQYIQDKPDHLQVNIIVDDTFSEEDIPNIELGLNKRIGTSLKYSFNIVTELEKKGSGKVPFIINKLGNRQ